MKESVNQLASNSWGPTEVLACVAPTLSFAVRFALRAMLEWLMSVAYVIEEVLQRGISVLNQARAGLSSYDLVLAREKGSTDAVDGG